MKRPPIIRWVEADRMWLVLDETGRVLHRAPTLLSAERWITEGDQ